MQPVYTLGGRLVDDFLGGLLGSARAALGLEPCRLRCVEPLTRRSERPLEHRALRRRLRRLCRDLLILLGD